MSTNHALIYAVRGPVVLRHLGQLSVLIALAGLPPLFLSIVSGSWDVALLRGVVVMGVGGAGYGFTRLRTGKDVQLNEAMVVVSLAFVVASIAAAIPFTAYGLTPIDALFEAVSGVTTTGLSIVPSMDGMSEEFLLVRGWTQWYGGLGFMTLSVFLFASGALVPKQLEPGQIDPRDPVGGTRERGRIALVVYLAVTLVGITGLLVSGMSPFDAILHTTTSISTGGFSSEPGSLAAFGISSRVVVLVLCVLGATPFIVLHQAARGSWRRLLHDSQLVGLVLLGLLATALIFTFSLGPDTEGTWAARLGHAAAFAFSAQTTAGFSTMDPAATSEAARLVMILAMLVGGGIGSTAGGIKITRLLIAGRVLGHTLRRVGLAKHAVDHPRFEGSRITPERAQEVLCLILLWLLVVVASWVPFLVAGHGALDSLFEVVSATGTVGLSTGVTGAELGAGLKLVLCLDMLFGRLEIVALLIVLAPRTWIGRRRYSS